eukprot:scaffold9246_cov13-Tisochrysis_lutea.AAC.1
MHKPPFSTARHVQRQESSAHIVILSRWMFAAAEHQAHTIISTVRHFQPLDILQRQENSAIATIFSSW